jgi:hypothetical protein
VRHDGTPAERVVPVAWEDLDNDNLPEISGNNAPTEPFGVGGQVAFTAGALPECFPTGVATAFAGVVVTSTDKAADRFEGAGCSFFYDSNDLFRIGGAPTDLAGFEAALNNGTASADVVGGTYDSDTADQSTFDITTNNNPGLTITDPSAAVTVDAATYAIKGTAVGGFTVAVYVDANDNGLKEAAESKLGETTAAADGTWTIVVPLTQDPDGIGGAAAVNNFVATQRSAPAASDTGTGTDVPAITESTGGVTFVTTDSTTDAGAPGFLDPGDVITITFSGDVTGVGSGDTLGVADPDGSTATITCGAAGNADCAEPAAGVVTITITNVLTTSGGNGGIAGSGTITSISGFTAADGAAISMSGDRTFTLP